jgi:hypothetical protein
MIARIRCTGRARLSDTSEIGEDSEQRPWEFRLSASILAHFAPRLYAAASP